MRAVLELQGRRALVTGGTKGIGEAVVARLLESGADVLTTARSRPSDLAWSDSSPRTSHGAGLQDRHRRGLRRWSGVDIIVHVAGGSSAPAGGSERWMTGVATGSRLEPPSRGAHRPGAAAFDD
jgi:NAD(P)-dependent dehydrogenase (short-subunit alcohol dehydrogenase family)